MKTVSRVALPGEKIVIDEEVYNEEKLDKAIHIVSGRECSPGFVMTTEGYIFKHSEYEVIENE